MSPEISAANLDVIRPAVLLPLPFDPALDELQCFLPCWMLTFGLHRSIVSALVQRGAEALG